MEGFWVDFCNNNVISDFNLREIKCMIFYQVCVEVDVIFKKYGLLKLGERFEILGFLDFDMIKFRGINLKDRYF